ncbi:hypothetical protein SNEBB_007607 [Seison nebaliae]|nr:hypothetical protein SNEBB_007607 [Seison nebaliae]
MGEAATNSQMADIIKLLAGNKNFIDMLTNNNNLTSVIRSNQKNNMNNAISQNGNEKIRQTKAICAVPGCLTNEKNLKPGMTLHKPPEPPEFNRRWLSSLNRKNAFSNEEFICSLHFRETDYAYDAKNKRRLVLGAIPSENLFVQNSQIYEKLVEEYKKRRRPNPTVQSLSQQQQQQQSLTQKIDVKSNVNGNQAENKRAIIIPQNNHGIHLLPKDWKAVDIYDNSSAICHRSRRHYESPDGKIFSKKKDLEEFFGCKLNLETWDFQTGRTDRELFIRLQQKQTKSQTTNSIIPSIPNVTDEKKIANRISINLPSTPITIMRSLAHNFIDYDYLSSLKDPSIEPTVFSLANEIITHEMTLDNGRRTSSRLKDIHQAKLDREKIEREEQIRQLLGNMFPELKEISRRKRSFMKKRDGETTESESEIRSQNGDKKYKKRLKKKHKSNKENRDEVTPSENEESDSQMGTLTDDEMSETYSESFVEDGDQIKSTRKCSQVRQLDDILTYRYLASYVSALENSQLNKTNGSCNDLANEILSIIRKKRGKPIQALWEKRLDVSNDVSLPIGLSIDESSVLNLNNDLLRISLCNTIEQQMNRLMVSQDTTEDLESFPVPIGQKHDFKFEEFRRDQPLIRNYMVTKDDIKKQADKLTSARLDLASLNEQIENCERQIELEQLKILEATKN